MAAMIATERRLRTRMPGQVERHTRYVMLAKVAGKDTRTVVTALIKQAKKLPKELYKSLTWDRGKELTDHRRGGD
jgi:transposase, IS30 family